MFLLVMKSKIQNSIKFLKRFFEPAFLDKASAVKIFVNGMAGSVAQVVVPLLFVPKILTSLEQGHVYEAKMLALLAFFVFTIVIFLRSFVMYYWYWALNIAFEKQMYIKYLPLILNIDSRVFEKNGTGYHLSKFVTGLRSISNTSREVLDILPKIILGLSMTFYILFSANLETGLTSVLYFILFVIIVVKVYRNELKIIFPSVEIWNRISGAVSRVIMSKTEINYSSKGQYETQQIVEKVDQVFNIEKTTFKYSMKRFYIISGSTMFVFLVYLLYSLFVSKNYSVSKVATYSVLTASFYTITSEVFKIISTLFDNYKNILAFWEMVDEPKMVGYEEGKNFEHKGGEIELKNISFSYESKF